ncbi:MAG: DUF6125 family protein [Thermodesulfobacteriota bacterium]
MDGKNLDKLSKEQLKDLVHSLLWQLRLTDAFWFIYTEKRFGLTAAEELNAETWAKVGKLAAREIKERFKITEAGLDGFLKAFDLFCWTMMVDYQKERVSSEQLLLSVASCPAQEGRKKHGHGEYKCKDMHHKEFSGFAGEIDPRIKVECVFAPPDPHPRDMYCKWRFTVSQEEAQDFPSGQ